jgi:hypothetical protein
VHTQDNQGNAADRIPLKKEEDGFFSEHVMETSGMESGFLKEKYVYVICPKLPFWQY